MDELQLYAAEVHCALKLADLVTILRQGITDGDSQELESLIQDSQSMMMQQSLRLGRFQIHLHPHHLEEGEQKTVKDPCMQRQQLL